MKEVMETEVITTRRRSHLRKLMWGALIASPFLFLLAWRGYEWYLDRDLRAAIADADRLDPGWRLADLEAARAEIPDEQNAALQVLVAHRLIGPFWNSKSAVSLEEELEHLSPEKQINRDQEERLRKVFVNTIAAIRAGGRLSEMPRGRYSILWSDDAVGTLVPHMQQAGELAGLLRLEILWRVHCLDIDGAVATCRAVLNVGRSFGDEPVAITQLIRLQYRVWCLRGLERALAQGEASEAALAEVQRLLEDESEQPLLLVAVRAERAGMHQFLEFVVAGGQYRAKFGMRSRTGSNKIDEFFDRGDAHGCHAAYLRYLNQCVEIAKLPPEQQVESLAHFELQPPVNVPQLLVALGEPNDFRLLARRFHASLAFLRCGIAALATERFRLANGRWPDRLEDLVPLYLSKLPIDPFDGQPLHLRRLKDGVIIYTVGEDQEDDGGQRVRVKAGQPDRDVGFQLWDPEHRRQPSGQN